MFCVNSTQIEGFEFEDNRAPTHITKENGIASTNFWVKVKLVSLKNTQSILHTHWKDYKVLSFFILS